MNKQNPIRVFGLTCDEINELKQIAKDRYGKASVSLLAKKLLQEQIRQPENTKHVYQENMTTDRQRLTLRLSPKHQAYLNQKALLEHSSLNDIVRDIISEHINNHPILSNDAVQALYQSNYQLLRLGRNINQLTRQFNAILPKSITTQQLQALSQFIEQHTNQVGKVLRQQNKPLKHRPIRELKHDYQTQSAN